MTWFETPDPSVLKGKVVVVTGKCALFFVNYSILQIIPNALVEVLLSLLKISVGALGE